MTGTTMTPPFWGVVLGFAVGFAVVIVGCFLLERWLARRDRKDLEAAVLAGLPQRTRRIPDDEIDTDWA